MKAHLMLALSVLLAAIFVLRTIETVQSGGSILTFLYLAGGFVFAGVLFTLGLRQRREDRAQD